MGLFDKGDAVNVDTTAEKTNPLEQPSAEQAADDFGAEDYPATPYVPDGTYRGEIAKFARNDDAGLLKITVLLRDNDGKLMEAVNTQSGAVETLENVPVDGNIEDKVLWDWKPGDEEIFTASKKYTKKSWAVKQFIDTGKALGIDVLNKNKQRELAASGELVGMQVEITMKTNTYKGKTRHEIAFIKAIESAD